MTMDTATTAPTTATPTGRTARTDRAEKRSAPPSSGGAVYGLGMIGALVYFIGTSQSGWDYVLALGKAVVWPALLVYEAFKAIGR
jgi:hypothetical protein